MKLKPRVVLVSGGSGSIGQAIVKHFAAQGDQVIAWGLDPDHLRATETINRALVKAEKVNVTKPHDVKVAIERIVQKHHAIDVVINAAGSMKAVTTDMPYEDAVNAWQEMLAVNLTSSFLIAEAASPALTRPGGRVVFVGSVSAYTGSGRPGGMAYAAAKAGLSGLVFGLAKELGPSGITVNAVVPGLIANTGITSKYPPDAVRGYITQTPMGRAGTPEDIAPAVAYLVSPEAEFVTGQFIHVNGGLLLGRS